MDRDRRLSYLILKDIEENNAWSSSSVGNHIAKEGADSPAFVRELCYGVLRNRLLLDYNIDLFLKKPRLGLSERIWLRMGFYQLSIMNGVKEYAAVGETVELARSFKKGCEGFINAVLRSFQRSGCRLNCPGSDDKLRMLSVKYSAHESIVKLWMSAFGEDAAVQLLAASNTPAPLCIRVNSLKTNRAEMSERLRSLGFACSEGTLTEDALLVKGSGLLDTYEYKKGYFSVQGESSQYAARILDPAPGSIVLDLCAAPGGKSCAMAELMNDQGNIYSFDYYEHRVRLIEKEAKRLGISIINAHVSDSSVYEPELEETADYVLCDVPCSGLGTLRENPEIKLRAVADIPVQRAILENALRYAKKGGKVLYSTCTINPAENEMITEGQNKLFEKQLLTEAGGPDGFYICLIGK